MTVQDILYFTLLEYTIYTVLSILHYTAMYNFHC